MFKKVINIFRKMLSTSNFSKMLINFRFAEAIKPETMPQKEFELVDHLVTYLYQNRSKLVAGLSPEEIDNEDPQQIYFRKYNQLLLSVAQHFEVIFITRPQHAS